jgi:hypothetical protein
MSVKTCAICKETFKPMNSLSKVCSPKCAIDYAIKQRSKAERIAAQEDRKVIRAKLARLKPGYLEAKAQGAINAYVRIRDHEKGCISCDKPANWHGQWHAGHLKTRGANSWTRYHLWNLNKQCSVCNNHHSGNVAEHERGIVERYGQERLDYLNSAPKSRRYDDDYLIRLAAIFRKRVRILKKRKGLA